MKIHWPPIITGLVVFFVSFAIAGTRDSAEEVSQLGLVVFTIFLWLFAFLGLGLLTNGTFGLPDKEEP